jgi:GT2 family glycosyltransferase
MRPETISFIVPVRNDAERLKTALESISRNTSGLVEIIVADNGSTDASVAVARTYGARVLELPGLRVSAMRNRAARVARGDVLSFVDADNEIGGGWSAAALECLGEDGVGAAGQLYDAPPNGSWVQRTYGLLRGTASGHADVDWLGSGNLAVSRQLFLDIGGFDESLTTCEDVDLCSRIRQRGGRIVRDSRLASVHHGDPDTLKAVFKGELWRGRDNVRVSLRRPLSWRSLTSLGVSWLVLVGLALVLASPFSPAPLRLLSTGVLAVASVVIVRGSRMLSANFQTGMLLRKLWQTTLVAGAYELGRALALVIRVPHRRPHKAPAAAHV